MSRYASRDASKTDFGGGTGAYEGRALAIEIGVLRARVEELARCVFWGLQRIAEAADEPERKGSVLARVHDLLVKVGPMAGLSVDGVDSSEELPEIDAPIAADPPAQDDEANGRPTNSPPDLRLVVSDGQTMPPLAPAPAAYTGPKRADWQVRQEEGPPPLEVTNPRLIAFMALAFAGTRRPEFLWRDYSEEDVSTLEEVYCQACAMVGGDEAHGYGLYGDWVNYFCTHQPDRRRSGPDAQTIDQWLEQMVRDCTPAKFMRAMSTYTQKTSQKPWYTPEKLREDLEHSRRDQYTQHGIVRP